jgi:hypothetical protein
MMGTTETFLVWTRAESEKRTHEELWVFYNILVKYVWMIPLTIGVPGNIISILVANRKRNQSLSPCIYMTAMAVADTLLLLMQPCFFLLTKWGLGSSIIHGREWIYK